MFIEMVNFSNFFQQAGFDSPNRVKCARIVEPKFSKIRRFFFLIFYLLLTVSPAWCSLQYGFFTTYDHLLIRTAKISAKEKTPKGTIVLLQGMGGFIEYYRDVMESLAAHGYDVLTLDWRGQGDSGRLSDQQSLLYIDNFASYTKDLKKFISLNSNMVRPVIFMASSMGGNIGLHYTHDYPEDVDAMIALAPMIQIKTNPYPYSLAEGLVRFIVSIGLGDTFVFGYEPFSYERCVKNYSPFKNGDKKIYLRDCRLLKEQPHLAISGPSFQWLLEAFKSSEDFNSDAYLNQIKVPFLMISSENDYLVNVEAQAKLCQRLSNCKLVTYPDAHHNILKDSRNIVSRLIKEIDTFFIHFTTLKKSSMEPQQQYVYRQNEP